MTVAQLNVDSDESSRVVHEDSADVRGLGQWRGALMGAEARTSAGHETSGPTVTVQLCHKPCRLTHATRRRTAGLGTDAIEVFVRVIGAPLAFASLVAEGEVAAKLIDIKPAMMIAVRGVVRPGPFGDERLVYVTEVVEPSAVEALDVP